MQVALKFFRKAMAIRSGSESPDETLTPFVVRILSFFGIWANVDCLSRASISYKMLMAFHHCVFAIHAATMMIKLFDCEADLFEFALTFSNVIAIVGAFFKAEILQWQRRPLSEIFAKIAENDEKLKGESRKDVKVSRLRGQYYWTELSLVVPFLFSDIVAVSFALAQIPKAGNELPFAATFPFDIEQSTFGYTVAYFIQCWATIFLSYNYILMDAGIGSCYNQIALHFQVIGMKVEGLGEIKGKSKRKLTLIRIIQEHDELYKLLNHFNTSLEKFFVVILGISLLTITFNTFTMVSLKANEVMLMVQLLMFWVVMTTTFLFWCYLGQKVQDMSLEVQTSIYNSDWTKENNETKKYILFMMMRAQIPARVRIHPFFPFNFESFAKVMKMSISYFMVLRDVST